VEPYKERSVGHSVPPGKVSVDLSNLCPPTQWGRTYISDGTIYGVDCVSHNDWTNIMEGTYCLMQVLNHGKGSWYPSHSLQ
jgi:hypothetical protein